MHINTQNLEASLFLDTKAQLGEGCFWHPKENKLYWVDIEGHELHITDVVSKGDKHFNTGSRIGCVVPVESGGALVALQNGIHFMDTQTGELTFLNNPLPQGIRFNDGKCDDSGRFWVGSMHLDMKEGAASLYRFDSDKNIHTMVTNVTCSNGIVWTADRKKMYYIDTPTGNIDAFDFDETTGSISNRSVAVKVPDGYGSPDGMCIDYEDKLWVALWGGNGVAKFDPFTGEMIFKINVPAPHTTCCTFGGKDLRTLFITTAWDGLNDEQRKQYPLSGGIFSIELEVKGVDTNFFKNE